MPRIDESTKRQRKDQVMLLLQKHPNGLKQREIAEKTQIQTRTVNNYLTELDGEAKAYKEGQLWFPFNGRDIRLRSFDLEPEEAFTLYLASRLFIKHHDKRNPAAESALAKLAYVLTSDAGIGREIDQAAQELRQRPEDSSYSSIYQKIIRGYIHRRQVEIEYKPLNKPSFTTTFQAYLIEPSAIGHATYVIGHSSLPDKLRAYKLERIQSAKLLRAEYDIPSDFPGLEILRNSWSIIMGDTLKQVELRFSPRVKARVLETQWHPSQEVLDDPDCSDYLRWRVEVADTTDLMPWIRSWGADVKIVRPRELVEELMGESRELAMMYGWHVSAQPDTTASREKPSLADTFAEFYVESF
ncbi:MAG: WYL domain-containing transcriptional regulator [Chloroflexota bacterium]